MADISAFSTRLGWVLRPAAYLLLDVEDGHGAGVVVVRVQDDDGGYNVL